MILDIKIRLLRLGKTSKDLITALHDKGLRVSPPEMSLFINGISKTPKAEQVLKEADGILKEWEAGMNAKSLPNRAAKAK